MALIYKNQPMAVHALQGKFDKYHKLNPHIYVLFDKFAKRLLENGYKTASPWLIMNRIRWEVNVETVAGMGFKIPNGFFGLISRMWQKSNPQHKGFFRTKKMKHEKENEWINLPPKQDTGV